MPQFIEEFYYGNIDPQARSTKENKAVQKQMEILTRAIDQAFWAVVNGESNLDSFIMGFRLGANFAYEAFVSTETPFQDLLKE